MTTSVSMRRIALWVAGLGILCVGGAVWWTVSPPPSRPFLSTTTTRPDSPRKAAPERPSQQRVAAAEQPAASPPLPAAGGRRDESHTTEPHSEESEHEEGRRRPHPDSPQRTEQLAHRMRFERIDQALASGDLHTAQRLLEEQERSVADHPSWEDWVQGYQVLLKCRLEPGTESTRAALDFEANHPASRMRRRVRRACLP